MSEGSTVNVWFELETDGDEDIRTQELKLSEDTCNVPEQEVYEVLVVTEVVSMDSEKVTEMDTLSILTMVPLSGVMLTTYGALPPDEEELWLSQRSCG